ncbi:AIPR family protein [Sinorhizobium terangae]|uniref:AIPR family protein n=1 Tax=Sinorhizobium terangae TaxID=110322 RepID=UPI0024B11BB4|nr:AIPR family protein [Sinorhizobium terangae]WFU51999.1 AIPR family protein [Sinorhizobium terangae]
MVKDPSRGRRISRINPETEYGESDSHQLIHWVARERWVTTGSARPASVVASPGAGNPQLRLAEHVLSLYAGYGDRRMNGAEAKYAILLNILDRIIQDGAVAGRRSIYRTASSTPGDRDQARARAYIHLFLEAKYGLYDFDEREKQITESSYDGGVDAFHVDDEEKVVVLVQSKFRTNAQNFAEKHISIGEVSRIDADRILRGETEDAAGNPYSGHIKGLQRRLQSIPDIAKYSYKVVLLANVREDEKLAVAKILSDFETEVYDFRRCYEELVIPVLRGEQTYFADLRFNIDMSNKSAGSRLCAKIATEHGPVNIDVILAPTLEIARLMSRYRNSILRYNPRSYLEFSQQSTNRLIRESITERTSGEFALLNNGITILSDETYVSEMIGQKDAALVALRNPQIINGGQTAFTLSRIYDEISDVERATMFEDKEVVVRIITLPNIDTKKKLRLIQEISSATNSQTQVGAADRVVVNDEQRGLARRVFLAHGLLYEHKRGEYADAVQKGFVGRHSIIERSIFLRLMLLANGDYAKATRSKSVKKGEGFKDLVATGDVIDRFGRIHAVFGSVRRLRSFKPSNISETLAMVEAVLAAMELGLLPDGTAIDPYAERLEQIWPSLVAWCLDHYPRHKRHSDVHKFGAVRHWAKSPNCPKAIRAYLKTFGLAPPARAETLPPNEAMLASPMV